MDEICEHPTRAFLKGWRDSAGSREMFYRNGEKIMAVDVETKPAFRSGTPKVRFEGKYRPAGRDYDVSPDGKRVVIIRDHEQKSPTTEIRVVQNWLEDLKQRVPVK